MTINDFIAHFPDARPYRDGYAAKCPAHADSNPSLHMVEKDGKILINCFGGCSPESIVGAVGLTMSDLFHGSEPREEEVILPPDSTATVQPLGCTLKQYAEAKALPVDFLESVGVTQISYNRKPALRLPYSDANGHESAVQFRTALVKPASGEDNRFRWKSGSKTLLYGLWRADNTKEACLLVEGASDCQTLWYHGYNALGVPGAANFNDPRDAYHLEGFDVIYVVVEPDSGGRALIERIGSCSLSGRVKLVRLGDWEDVSTLHVADPDQFSKRFEELLEVAVPLEEMAAAQTAARLDSAWKGCHALAGADNILDEVVHALRLAGVVGETVLLKLIYLVVGSRLLDKPLSLALKGPSSGGKSYLVEQVLCLFPENAYYALTAMSERALAYGEEPLKHRTLVLYEAAGMEGEMTSYLLRSLLSEGCVRYETVDKTPEGLKSILIEREGPTGLIVTTTRTGLHPENETRMISATVTDTPDHTRLIMRSIARRGQAPDLSQHQALQTWLQLCDNKVNIPYAEVLADLIPPIAVRLRRDFSAILTLIETHALLHQATRATDAKSQIVATVEDYTAVREIVADLIAEGVERTVHATIRETVQAVEALPGDHGVTAKAVSEHLRLDKSTGSRRCRKAADLGYIRNLEDTRGKPSRYVLGDPMAEDQEILPSSELLIARLNGCTVDGNSEGGPPPLPLSHL